MLKKISLIFIHRLSFFDWQAWNWGRVSEQAYSCGFAGLPASTRPCRRLPSRREPHESQGSSPLEGPGLATSSASP